MKIKAQNEWKYYYSLQLQVRFTASMGSLYLLSPCEKLDRSNTFPAGEVAAKP